MEWRNRTRGRWGRWFFGRAEEEGQSVAGGHDSRGGNQKAERNPEVCIQLWQHHRSSSKPAVIPCNSRVYFNFCHRKNRRNAKFS